MAACILLGIGIGLGLFLVRADNRRTTAAAVQSKNPPLHASTEQSAAVQSQPGRKLMSHNFQIAGKRAIHAIENEYMGIPTSDTSAALDECDVQRTNSTDAAAYHLLQNLYVHATLARLKRQADEARSEAGSEPRTDSENIELEYRTCKKLADQSFSNGEVAAGALTRCSNENTE